MVKKIIFFLFLVFFSLLAQAQFRDPYYINLSHYNGLKDPLVEINLGAPPIKVGSTMWINSLNLKYWQIDPAISDNNRDYSPSSYAYASFINSSINKKWSYIFGINLSVRNAYGGLNIESDSLFTNSFLLFTKKMNHNPLSTWSIGLVILDRTSRIPVAPGVAWNLASESGRHVFIIAFPRIGYIHKYDDETKVGGFVGYENTGFLLPNSNIIRQTTNNKYLNIERALVNLFWRKRFKDSNFYWTASLGYTFWGHVQYQDKDDLNKRQTLQKEKGLYSLVGISYSFNKD